MTGRKQPMIFSSSSLTSPSPPKIWRHNMAMATEAPSSEGR